MCPDWKHIGITCNGTFAEYVTLRAEQAHELPEGLSFEEAALLEPLSLVVRSLEQSKPMVGETVAILGPGSLGIMHLLAYRAAGASRVVLVGLNNDRTRLAIARELGANHVVNIDKEDPVQAILSYTDNWGTDIVVETANSPGATQLAFNIAGPRGRIVLFGLYPEATFSPVKMLRNGLTVFGDVGAASRQFLTAIRWMASGRVSVRNLITTRLGLSDCAQAFEIARRGNTIKVVFEI
jgi:threonine dehydrogenase-like Zn-dependent dehydrogenase